MELKRKIYDYYEYEKLSFNRTLWNWNNLNDNEDKEDKNLLIVPYGIETAKGDFALFGYGVF